MSYKDAKAKQNHYDRDRFNHLMDYSRCWERRANNRPSLQGRFVGPVKWFRWAANGWQEKRPQAGGKLGPLTHVSSNVSRRVSARLAHRLASTCPSERENTYSSCGSTSSCEFCDKLPFLTPLRSLWPMRRGPAAPMRLPSLRTTTRPREQR
jgi:hypothetical protein